MGFLDRFRRTSTNKEELRPSIDNVVVGANNDNDIQTAYQSFNNTNITFNGELSGYNYDSILRDKQNFTNLVSLYELADYYSDADPLIRGIIHHVYVPYSTCSDWVLTGANEKTYKMYEEKYKQMRLREKLVSIMLEYWKYGNVFVYFYDDNLVTLPVHKCRIGNIAIDGTPIVDYDCQTTLNEWRAKGYNVKENWIKDNDLESYFKGFPKEVAEAMNNGEQFAQLNPENTFVLQGTKEGWQRYCVPFIASCLASLAKKELISSYENSLLNLGIRSFVHVTYGDSVKGQDILTDVNQINAVDKLFKKAMSGFPLVTTNHLARAQVVQPDTNDLFQWDNYKNVNNDILSAGGISGIIVSGTTETGSSFASAQVSMQTAATRIEAARDEFCEMMNKLNERLVGDIRKNHTNNLKNVPKFNFLPLDMAGKKSLRDSCQELWEKGLVSTKTMMENYGYSLERERYQREEEASDGTDEVLIPREKTNEKVTESTNNGTEETRGRPELDDEERNSDPANAIRGKQPKPSNPEPGGEQSI